MNQSSVNSIELLDVDIPTEEGFFPDTATSDGNEEETNDNETRVIIDEYLLQKSHNGSCENDAVVVVVSRFLHQRGLPPRCSIKSDEVRQLLTTFTDRQHSL